MGSTYHLLSRLLLELSIVGQISLAFIKKHCQEAVQKNYDSPPRVATRPLKVVQTFQ